MKKIIGVNIALSIVASSLMASNYYPYTGKWHFPSSYSDGYRQDRWTPQARPTKRPQYKSLEQQYDNLIIMFTKDECGFCRYMMPIMKQVERKFGKDIKFLYVDIEQNPQYPAQYGFSTVPHIVYFKDGKKLDAHGSGDKTMTVEQVEEKIRNLGM